VLALILGFTKIYQNFDGVYYIVVAQTWYQKALIAKNFSFPLPLEYYAAHFPLYPFLIKVATFLPFLNPLRAMLIVNYAATVLAAIVIYELAKSNNLPKPFWISLAWLFVWPRMLTVRSVGSPETLFILWVFLSLKYFDLKKYWLATVFGILATLTKSPGILLFPAFLLTERFDRKAWPVLLIPISLLLLFTFYYIQTGDFWAYFHSGDNIHLQVLPFKVFDSSQPWVGSLWLEEVIWIYFVAGIGIYNAFRKKRLWGCFGLVYYLAILFVSHRDVSRYSLPLVPIVLFGLSDMLEKKEVRVALCLIIVPIFFYTLNFMFHNTVTITDWAPFLKSSI
jgi:hypothetical protein